MCRVKEDGRIKSGHDDFVVRHSRARPANLPLARDGRIKSGHDDWSGPSPE
jgi:hypothetical protein